MPSLNSFQFRGAAGVALLFLAAVHAPAGPMPTLWSYMATPGAAFISTGVQFNGSMIYGQLLGKPLLKDPIAGSATLDLYNVYATSLNFTPNDFQGSSFTTELAIKDVASGRSAEFNFTGVFDGAPFFSQMFPAFTSPQTQSMRIGSSTYTVTEQFDGGGRVLVDADTEIIGKITANVTVSSTPEPATLTLAGLGLAGAAVARWRRRRAD